MKFLKFFGIFATVVGAIGGFGYAAFQHQWFIAVCVAVLAGAAVPTVIKWYKDITDPE